MKRDRIFNRRALVWGGWTLALLAGLSGLFVWHSVRSYDAAIRRFERHVGSSKHEAYLQDPVPDDQNAAIAFRAAVSGVELGEEWYRTLEPVAWSAETAVAARDILARHELALGGLGKAAGLPDCVWPAMTQGDSASMSAASDALKAAQILRLLGFVGVIDDDEEQVERSFQILGSLAECLYAQPQVGGSIIAAAAERLRLELVHAAVSNPATGAELLETFGIELERNPQADRVRWAVAAEGALALMLVEEGQPSSPAAGRRPFRSPFSRRIATALALGWVEFRTWSEKPFEELLSEPELVSRQRSGSVTGLVADVVVSNLRHAVVSLRTNEALVDLALVAIEARRYGQRHGSYAGAFDGQAGIGVLSEGDGSIVLIDSELESVLRAHSTAAGAGEAYGIESTLDLTVWRLPPPLRERTTG